MKKIGLLIDTMNGGGAQRVVSHLSGILSSVYDVTVILFDDSNRQYECGAKIHSLGLGAHYGSTFTKLNLLRLRTKALRAFIKKEKLECVISFLDSPNFVNIFSGVSRCRKVISIRNYSGLENSRTKLGKLTDAAMKKIYRRADCVVTVSKLLEKDFTERYRISKSKIKTIYNPYNFDDIDEKKIAPLDGVEQTFFDGGFVFSNVGRIMYQKAPWHLIKALYIAKKKHPEARLVIVGDDYTHGRLRTLIKKLDLADSVFLTGRASNPYKYMKNSDCYILSSLFEGFPNAMVEAMACGCPIIATDCKSGPREILFDAPELDKTASEVTCADYGILVPDLEPEENWDPSVFTSGEEKLAEAMIKLIEDKDLAENLSKKSEQRSHDFDFDRCRKAFSEVIEG